MEQELLRRVQINFCLFNGGGKVAVPGAWFKRVVTLCCLFINHGMVCRCACTLVYREQIIRVQQAKCVLVGHPPIYVHIITLIMHPWNNTEMQFKTLNFNLSNGTSSYETLKC